MFNYLPRFHFKILRLWMMGIPCRSPSSKYTSSSADRIWHDPGCLEYDHVRRSTTPCLSFAYEYDVSIEDIFAWNPSLEKNISTCTLQPVYSYCVVRYQNDTIPPLELSHCWDYKPTEPGTAPNCNCFNSVDRDEAGFYGCEGLIDEYSITMDQVVAWNTWLAGDCDAALFANLDKFATRVFCIGVDNSISTSQSNTVPVTTTQSATPAAPTQTGVASGCQKFHIVQSGDTCPSIESEYGITAAQFYQWNPSIGSTCTNLWLGYAYCVQGPSSSITGPTAPTQIGIAPNCTKYYTVVSGDSRAKLERGYGITFAQLYQWNPAIGSGCQYLQIGTSVCVGVS